MVRDLQWVNPTIVAVAVGKDIQLVQVGATGFDETVCVTDLEKHDVLLKFDARNVVSSVRWMPGEGLV
ncbi:hypothetical protein DYB28_007796 [Aphanomyces astaci]|uniref:Uncharacterized protein n=1 Tax=Aphanomyces astaci TaxID=112090 RepID=A0A9X8H2K6_APHAT|nr:hypothetical protein DYB28_007796 [Aphanomyces astaci]